jgi:hypothetical protein
MNPLSIPKHILSLLTIPTKSLSPSISQKPGLPTPPPYSNSREGHGLVPDRPLPFPVAHGRLRGIHPQQGGPLAQHLPVPIRSNSSRRHARPPSIRALSVKEEKGRPNGLQSLNQRPGEGLDGLMPTMSLLFHAVACTPRPPPHPARRAAAAVLGMASGRRPTAPCTHWPVNHPTKGLVVNWQATCRPDDRVRCSGCFCAAQCNLVARPGGAGGGDA